MSRPSRKPLDKDLYAEVVAEAKARFAVWPSAYASGWVVKTYKARGGRYGGGARGEGRSARTGLTKWFGEKWVDLSRPIREGGEIVGYEPCGRKEGKDDPADYPKCRPLKAAMRMSTEEVADAVRRKRRAEAGRGTRGGRGARAPVRVATYRENPYDPEEDVFGPVVRVDELEDGTVVEYVEVPFPVERKPLAYRDDPKVQGLVNLDTLIATQRHVSKAGVEQYLGDDDRSPPRPGTARMPALLVLETSDGRQYIADGHHRAFAAYLRDIAQFPAIIQFVRE